jgi:DNA polymerase-1
MPGVTVESSLPPRPRLFLVDGYSTLYRAFFAIRELSNSKGEPTNGVYGFVNMLRKLLREEKPELLGVAWDGPEKTLREERFAEYKAQRAPMPEDLVPQIPWVRRVLEAYRIPILELARYEADDVIGTLSCRAAEAGYDVVLVTADKDMFQLVGPHVSLMHTGRGRLYDPAAVEEDFGVPPAKVIDVLALMGDTVDNVPGVPGIGEKGARQLVKEYGSIEVLLERAAEIPRKAYREGLQNHREQALMSKELVTIHTDLDIAFEPDALRLDPPDLEALRAVFGELEFFSLVEELTEQVSKARHVPSTATPALEIATVEGWNAWLAERQGFAEMTIVRLASGELPWGVVLSTGATDLQPAWIDARSSEVFADFRSALARWTLDPGLTLVGHDLKEILRWVPEGEGRHARIRLRDAQLLSYVANPALSGHGLEEIALERLRRSLAPIKGDPPLPGSAELLAAAGERIAILGEIFEDLERALAGEPALRSVYDEIEAPLVPVLVGMEELGIGLDVPFLRTMSGELATELASLEQEIHGLAGEPFNLQSPQQLGAILFDKLGLPVLGRTRKTKSYSTDAETLEELSNRGYPLPGKLLRFRELAKLKSTYVDALPALVGRDGRLHTRIQQAVAATGRLSSVNPNLQNIPIRTELGEKIRRAFRAAPGQRLVVADYNQIELRVLAHIAGEEALTQAFRAGEDIHRSTAATVFNVAPELVSSEQRRAAKVINFGILYGMSAFGLGRTLGIPSAEADRFIKAYLERFPAVRRYMDETLAEAQRTGRVQTLFGRVRPLPDIHSKNFNLRENARRMAINARIQGTAADLLKKAMIALCPALEPDGARLLLTVHDELVVEAPEDRCEAVAVTLRRTMTSVAELAVPLLVDVGIGDTWSSAKP